MYLKPQGYGCATDPDSPVPIEHDTFTCSHCNRIVMVPPGINPDTIAGNCKGCMGLLCVLCWAHKIRGNPCETWLQKLDQVEARNYALRSYGL